jgi:hypothetical protein
MQLHYAVHATNCEPPESRTAAVHDTASVTSNGSLYVRQGVPDTAASQRCRSSRLA